MAGDRKFPLPVPEWPAVAFYEAGDIGPEMFLPSDVFEPWGVAVSRINGEHIVSVIARRKNETFPVSLETLILQARLGLQQVYESTRPAAGAMA